MQNEESKHQGRDKAVLDYTHASFPVNPSVWRQFERSLWKTAIYVHAERYSKYI